MAQFTVPLGEGSSGMPKGHGFQKPLWLVTSRHKMESQPHCDGSSSNPLLGSEKVVPWSDVSVFLSTESLPSVSCYPEVETLVLIL